MASDLTNWAGNLTYRAAAVHHPTTVDQVQELVARLPRVRALGTRHSFSAVADQPGGALISLAGLAPELSVDRAAMTASVTGGTRYGELAAALHARGYGLANTGSLPHISVAGATATGTHGSGDGNGILATAVAAVEIVRAGGSLVTLGRADPAFGAVAVGLGMFGVITRVVLDVEPTYAMRQDVYVGAPWDRVLDEFDAIMASAYSVSLMGDPGARTCGQVWLKERVPDGGLPPAPRSRYGGSWYDDADLPPDVALTPRAGVVGPWSERLPHFRPDAAPSAGGDELQSEYVVDRRHAVPALRAVRELGPRLSPHLHAMEVRTVAADELWLSPAQRRPGACLGFTWRRHPEAVAGLVREVEAALAPFAARPHWGKLSGVPADELVQRFPRLAEFRDLAREWDPSGTFAGVLPGFC